MQLLSVIRNRDHLEIEKSSYSLGTDFSVAKTCMFLPFFFSFLNDFNIFFKLLPRQKEKRKFSRITTLNARYSYSNGCEFIKIIDVNWWLRNKYESDFRSNDNYLSSSENKVWKDQACSGLETTASAIPMQRSANWAKKPTGSWLLCWFVINPWSDE